MQYKAAKQAAAVQKEALEFQKERYAKWQSIYGPLQEDLSTYYKNLTGKSISNEEVQKIQMELQKANEQTSASLAARGISGSGVEASLLNSNEFNADMLKAQSIATGDQKAAALKSGFLNAGMGLESNAASAVSNTSANYSNAINGQGRALGNMWTAIGNTVDGAFGYLSTKNIGSAR